MKCVLDIGAGKYNSELLMYNPSWINDEDVVIVHVDRCYPIDASHTMESLARKLKSFIAAQSKKEKISDICNQQFDAFDIVNQITKHHCVIDMFCHSDIFDFMDNFPLKPFDRIICNRMFEHLEYCGGEVGRMLEACNAISKNNATLEFVVPNANTLCDMVLNSELNDNDVMIINTEFCNGKFDPHASVWSPRLAHKYIDQEATWEIIKIVEKFPFAGRDIYMKIWCRKPAGLQYNKDNDNGVIR